MKSTQTWQRNTWTWLFLALILFFFSEVYFRMTRSSSNPKEAAAEIEHELQSKIPVMTKWVEQWSRAYPADPVLPSALQEAECFVYQGDSLVYWEGNRSGGMSSSRIRSGNGKVLQAGNGYYYICSIEKGNRLFSLHYPVATLYRFTNYYLQNHLNSDFHIGNEFDISDHAESGHFPVKVGDRVAFYLGVDQTEAAFHTWHHILLALHLLGFFLLAVVITRFLLGRNAVLHPGQVVIWSISIIAFRLLLLFGNTFQVQEASPWFNPEIFASGMWAPSLGDFFLNAWCVFYITSTLATHFEHTSHPALWVRKIAAWVLIPLFILLGWFVQFSVKSLIEDSGINYSIRDISSFTTNSLLGIVSVGLTLFGLYKLIHAWARISYDTGLKRAFLWLLITWPVLILLRWPTDLFAWVECSWPVAACGVYLFLYHRDRELSLNWLIVLLGFFSVVVSVTMNEYGEDKEQKNRLLIAERLTADEDPETEIGFSGFERKLIHDSLLLSVVDSSREISNREFYKYIDTTYLSAINNHYHVSCYLFYADSTPVFINLYNPGALQELAGVLRDHSRTGVASTLRFIPERQNGLLYAGLVPLRRINRPVEGIFAIELRPKQLPDRTGLQELLWNKNQLYKDVLENYSVLRVVKDKVILRTGAFTYNGDPQAILKGSEKYRFVESDEANHLFFRTRERQVTVVSLAHLNWLSKVTSFSYVFIIFTILFFLLLALFRWKSWSLTHMSLRGKIQFSLILLLLIAMALLATGTQYTVSKQYREKNQRLLSEKLESVTTEMEHKIGSADELDEDGKNYIGFLLTKFSRVFHTDIHFYSASGELIGSSVEDLFRFGILPRRMNDRAYHILHKRQQNDLIQNEQVASMRFLSGYQTFFNEQGELLGYLNIPYFAPRASVDAEISSIVMAILNIFVVLFVLALAASLVFTQIITAPLRKIQGSLASIQLNQVNQPIEYSGRDEIADLVSEYNRKVAELELYATELARSERESAWREMARQVAHEIKNPLTPMKLNVQHMQRSLRPDDPELENKVKKLANSLIEQIDILTHIADDFSNMAKMPLARMEEVDVYELIDNVIHLFAEMHEIQIHVEKNAPAPARVRADRDQMVRVLNNLIKNAQQAMEEQGGGDIHIKVERTDDVYKVTVTDSGPGIPEELHEKIFRPNFTTKSTGSGLGLAMVKSIVEQHGGDIWFVSKAGEGTTFTFTLPVVKQV